MHTCTSCTCFYPALQVLATSPEGDVLVAKNHTNRAVKFICHVEGGEPYWELAMHQLPKEFNESGIVVNSNATHSFLTITPTAIDTIFKGDSITVRCIAFRHNPFQSVPGKFSHIIRYGNSAMHVIPLLYTYTLSHGTLPARCPLLPYWCVSLSLFLSSCTDMEETSGNAS